MRVREIMTVQVVCCGVNDDLAQVTSAMYEKDCGAIPVVGPEGTAVGMITDRDVAIAAATRNRPPSMIVVAEVITGILHFCSTEDALEHALEVMSRHQVRRLPVLDSDGRVAGVLSLNDIVRHAAGSSRDRVLRGLALRTASRIFAPHGQKEGDSEAEEQPVRRRTVAVAKRAERAGRPGRRNPAAK